MITIKLTGVQAALVKQSMAGDSGEVLCDIITDQIVLSDQLTAEQAQGAGMVLKFLRSVLNDTDNLLNKTK